MSESNSTNTAWIQLMASLTQRFLAPETPGLPVELDEAVRELGRFVRADAAYLFDLDAGGETAQVTHAWWSDSPEEYPTLQRIDRDTLPEEFARLSSDEAVRIDDAGLLEPDRWLTRRELARRQVRAVLWLPLPISGRFHGWFGCEVRRQPRVWSDELVDHLRVAVDILAHVMERRRSEAQLAFHLDNLPLGMLQWDGDRRVQRWSPAATSMFGWTAEEVFGRDWSEFAFVHPDDSERVAQIAHQLIHSERQSNASINRNLTKDGRILTCEWFNSAMLDGRGRPVSYLSFVRDVSDRERMRVALEDSRGELQRLNTRLEQRVTERTAELERTKTASDEQARMLRVILDESPVHTYLFDQSGRCIFVSRAVRDDLGAVAASLVDRTPPESDYPPEVVEDFMRLWGKITRQEGPQRAEANIETVRGMRQFEYTLTPIRNGAGDLGSAVLAAHDITERTRTEAALRESEVRYRQLAEHATDMISRHDPQGRFTYVSPACRRLLGFEPDELIGTMPRHLAHLEDRSAVSHSLTRLRTERGVISTSYRAIRKDGSTVWLESASRNTGDEIVVVTRDISARQRALNRLRLIETAVAQVGDAVVITGPEIDAPGPRIVYANQAFCDMTGYGEDELLGRSPRLLQGPGSEPEVLRKVRQCLLARTSFTGQTTNYRKDGSSYVVEWHINPLLDADGRVINWVSIQRDITQRVEQETFARQHREEVAHVGRLLSLGEMASGIAHEINQPLTALNAYAGGCLRLLKEDRGREAIVTAMNRVAEQVNRVSSITGNLRDFGSKRPTRRDPHDLNHLVRQALDLFEAEAENRSVRVIFKPADGLPPLLADGIQIEQVLVNLARNAMDAVEQQSADRRVIEIHTRQDEGGHLLVEVHDSGPCVSDREIRRMFDPFYTTKAEGMGMGLTISQSIADAHDGKLWAHPREGGGCIFSFRLPVAVET